MEEENKVIEEKANGWFVVLSVLIPLAGLITFLCWKDTRPKTAKASGIAALISFIVCSVLIPLILGIITTFMLTGDNGVLTRASNLETYSIIADAEDQVSIAIQEAYVDYMNDKYVYDDESINLEKYLNQALREVKNELSYEGITLTATGNKISLIYDGRTVSGTISDSGKGVIWETIE